MIYITGDLCYYTATTGIYDKEGRVLEGVGILPLLLFHAGGKVYGVRDGDPRR